MPRKKRKLKSGSFEATKYLTECLICGAKEKTVATKLDLTQAKDQPRLYHVQCQKCHHALLTLLEGDNLETSSIGLFTDLSAADALRLRRDFNGIEPDAVLEVHNLLQKNIFFDKIERKLKNP